MIPIFIVKFSNILMCKCNYSQLNVLGQFLGFIKILTILFAFFIWVTSLKFGTKYMRYGIFLMIFLELIPSVKYNYFFHQDKDFAKSEFTDFCIA